MTYFFTAFAKKLFYGNGKYNRRALQDALYWTGYAPISEEEGNGPFTDPLPARPFTCSRNHAGPVDCLK
jgi:hypothetical protein